MGAEVTDPSILSAFAASEPPPAAAPPPDAKEVTDPAVLGAFTGPATDALKWDGKMPQDKMPFGDQVSISQAHNPEEVYLYMAHRYGAKNVSRTRGEDGKPQVVVKTDDGKVYRVGGSGDASWSAAIVGDIPQIGGAIAGGVLGLPGGPVGVVAGAGVGAMAGQSMTEMGKAVRGEYSQSVEEGGANLGSAAISGAEGEVGGQVVGKAATKVLTGRLPAFLSGATEESRQMTKDAMAAGGKPPYASMGPDLMKLRRIEVVGEKLTGKYAKQDERNMAYVTAELSKKLKASGMPKAHVDKFIEEINGEEYAVSHREVGEQLQASAQAYVGSVEKAVDDAARDADSHIDAQLKNVTAKIDSSKHGDLTGHVADMVNSANKDFTEAASSLYDKAERLAGGKKIVPVDRIAEEARKIAAKIKEATPTQVAGVVKDMSKLAGKQLSEDDAILMKEFGIELPSDGKMSISAAQRLRTMLREKASGPRELTSNTTKHEYGMLRDAVDEAMQSAEADPEAAGAVRAMRVADDFYKRGIAKFKDKRLDMLMSDIKAGTPPDPEKLVQALAQPGRSTRTNAMKKLVGEDVWKQVQSVHLNQYMNRFVETVDGKQTINGMKLLQNLRDGDGVLTLQAVHGEQSVTDMRELAEMVAARRGQISPQMLKEGDPKKVLQNLRGMEAVRDEFMRSNALKIIADPAKTGEEAYQYLARAHGAGGDESRLLDVQRAFGSNSPQMLALRQAGLEELARNASIKAINKSGNNAIDTALDQFSRKQREILFPNGEDRDLRDIGKVIKFMFPFKSGEVADSGMAGMHAGAIQEKPIRQRLYQTAVAGIMRYVVLHPYAVKWIITGREAGEPWIANTANLLRGMTQVETMEPGADSGPAVGDPM